MHNSLKVLGVEDYLGDLSSEIKKAKKRIIIQTMLFEPGNFTDAIVLSLEKANRKANKTVVIDWFSLIFDRKVSKSHQKQLLLEKVNASGAKLKFSNKPSLIERIFPYKGRNHIKVSIVDDISYIGGVNMWDKELLAIDLMAKIKNKKLSDALAKEAKRSWGNDLSFKINEALAEPKVLIRELNLCGPIPENEENPK